MGNNYHNSFFMMNLHKQNEYETCMAKCVDDNYYCIDNSNYEEYEGRGFISLYDAKMCHWDINDCELGCRNK